MKNIFTLALLLGLVTIGKSQVPSSYPSTNLLAFYPFSGNANDVTSNGANAVVVGSQLTTDRFGNFNEAYAFNGIDQYMACYSTNLNNLNIFTISFWIKIDEYPIGGAYVFSKGKEQPTYGDRLSWRCYLGGNPYQYVGTDNWFPTRYATTNPYSNNSWTHIVLTNTGTAQQVYINGLLSSTVAQSGTLRTNTDSLYIGTRYVLGSIGPFFKGKLDEIAIWNRALTSGEIATLYSSTTNRNYYTKSNGSINLLSTWGTNADGSGTSPLSFDSSNTIYNVVNGNTTLTGDFNIGGNNSVIVFGNGSTAATFSIAAGDTLSVDSVYLNNAITLSVSGGLHSNRLASGSGSTAQYISNLPQRIAAGTYENLIVSSALKTMFGDVTVRGTLGMLTSINAQTFELTLGTSPTVRGTLNRTAGTVSGRFSRWFLNATNAGTTGLFPIGNFSRYAPTQIEFTSAPTTGGKLTCEYISGSAGSNGLPLFDFTNGFIFLDKVSPEGIVRLSASQGITGGTYTVSYTANSYPGVNIYSNLRLIYRSVGGSWTTFGSAGTNTGSNSSATLVRTGLTSLSGEFGVGGDQSENPLPVKFASIKATKIDNSTISIKWRTSFEYNASHFVVQRSTDKNYWVNLNKVPAQGNSLSTVNYQYTDYSTNHRGVIYYRLIQVDLDGKMDVSSTVSVDLDSEQFLGVSLYPNPTNGVFEVKGILGPAVVYNIAGVKVMEIYQDGNVDLSSWPNGIYFLKTPIQTLKIVKSN